MNTIAFALAEGLVRVLNASGIVLVLFPGIWLGYQLSEFILQSMHIPRDFGMSLVITFITILTAAIAVNTALLYALVQVLWRIRKRAPVA